MQTRIPGKAPCLAARLWSMDFQFGASPGRLYSGPGAMTGLYSAEKVADAVRSAKRVVPRGGGTKPALCTADGAEVLDLRDLTDITEYLPDEYTVTALAGTPLADVRQRLALERQYLPFDPLLVNAGSTVGGAVASGANGPGRFRYGGVRDFLLAVTFVDGRGEIVRGGAKVVKNAAGFDLPKLMVGSLGRLGVLVECTFKVFPHADAHATLRVGGLEFDEALAAASRVGAGRVELECLDLVHEGGGHGAAAASAAAGGGYPDPGPALESVTASANGGGAPGGTAASGWRLEAQVGGLYDSLDARLERTAELLGGDVATLRVEADGILWRDRKELAWAPADASVLKVPVTPASAPRLEQVLADLDASGIPRVLSAGVQQAFLAWPADRTDDLRLLDSRLNDAGLAALVLRAAPGAAAKPILGRRTGGELLRRVQQALDPESRFAGLERQR